MLIKILIIIFSLTCLACNNNKSENSQQSDSRTSTEMKFDKTKWRVKNDADYLYRDKMLHDLVYNVQLKGLKTNEVLELLGEPDRIDSSYFFYRIAQKRLGFFPLHTKTLVLKFSEDSTLEWRKIHE